MANEFKIKNGLYVSGSATVTNNITVSGSLDVVGGITGSLSGSAISASHALDSDTLGGLPSSSFAPAATFNDVSSSYASASGSLSTRVTDLESTASVLTSASASFAVVSSSYESASGSLSTRVTNLESTSSTVSSSFASTSGSISGRVTLIEGQYATTGSNVFTGPQFINEASNAIGFTSTASLYTPGGARITKDLFVSGTSYFNNVVVYGTSSIQYITSSQVNFGTNIITVNTDTPAVRFGGLAVFDSGSTQLTGSMLWDSERNHWVYSNPSGSGYSGGMIMSGPRSSALGSEQGTTSCAVMIGQGGDHITSSAIYSYGNATCFYGNSYIDSSGNSCQAGYAVVNNCLGIGTASPSVYGVDASNASNSVYFKATSNATTAYYGAATALGTGVAGTFSNHDFALYANSIERARITSTGIACFACQVCAAGNLLLGGAGTANTIPQYTAAGVLGNSKMVTYGNGCYNVNFGWSNCARIGFDNDNTGTYFYGLELDNGTRRLNIIGKAPDGNTGVGIWTGTTSYSQRLNIGSDGLACFACQVCAPTISISGNVNGCTATFNGVAINNSPTSAGTSANFIRLTNTGGDFYIGQESSTGGFFTGAGAYDNVLYGGRPLNIIMGGSSKAVIFTNGVACFSCQICAKAAIIATDCSGVIVDVASRHGLMKYVNYSTGLVGACSGTDSNIATWMGRFAGSIFAPTAVYQDLIINGSGKVMIATSCAAFGRNLTVQGDVVAYYSDQESVTMGISAGTGAQSWGIQVCDTGDGSNTLHLNARGGYVGINKGAGNSASYPLDVSGTTKTDVLLVGSNCSPSAGINYLGKEGYREKWLITQGRFRFCFGTQDFYGAIFIEAYGTNYNQGTSEIRNVKAAVNLRYGFSKSIGQIYNLGGACVGGYLTNGIGLVWCNITDSVADLIYTNAGSNQPDAVLATELQFLSAGYSLAGRFTRICYTNTLYDSVNPYV